MLVTAPSWDTFLYMIRITLFIYSFFEFPVRWLFSARLRQLRKEFLARKGGSRLPSDSYYTSPIVGKWITSIDNLHGRYVKGRLHSNHEEMSAARRRAEAFAQTFGVRLEEESDLHTLAGIVRNSLRTACEDVRKAEYDGFKHVVDSAMNVAKNMATHALQFGLWPRDDNFISWIRQVNKGKVEERFILTYYFCLVDEKELPMQQDAAPKVSVNDTGSGTSDGGSEEPAQASTGG